MRGILAALVLRSLCLSAVAADAKTEVGGPADRSWFTHPALEHGLVTNPNATPEQLAALRTTLEGQAKDILALTEAQRMAVLPDQTPRIHNACPACARRRPVPIPEQPQPFPGVFDPLHRTSNLVLVVEACTNRPDPL